MKVGGREVALTNESKVLYPDAGFTKGEVIDYYRRIAPQLVPHLAGRPLTLKRYPNGVKAKFFFEKNATRSRPQWVKTVSVYGFDRGEDLDFILCDDAATLVFVAQLAALELHPALGRVPALESPTMVVFDLDPGPPADLVTCCKAALVFRELFERLGLESVAKTSGNKGLQLYVPLNTPTRYEDTKGWARAIAEDFERLYPELFVSQMKKSLRPGKIFVDWSQNDFNKTTVAVYSLRARERPTVSTPVSWREIADCYSSNEPERLVFEAPQVLERVEQLGDLFAPALKLKQQLPTGPRVETPRRGRRPRN